MTDAKLFDQQMGVVEDYLLVQGRVGMAATVQEARKTLQEARRLLGQVRDCRFDECEECQGAVRAFLGANDANS